jgi:hypothetical protein
MSFDLDKILESQRALRRQLATRSVAEKLRMLDALRERELAIAGQQFLWNCVKTCGGWSANFSSFACGM